MTVRTARCRCGAVSAECAGEPVRISACHCIACKRRTGSAFSVQARWPADQVRLTGETTTFRRTADSGRVATYRFCPRCGSTVAYETENLPGLTAVPVGAFGDPAFPPPAFSIYESRKPAWVEVTGDGVLHCEEAG